MGDVKILEGAERKEAIAILIARHYTRSVPSGKSHYVRYGDAIIVWSIPANKNIAKFVLGYAGIVWELSRLWAPDDHVPNLLTQAISHAVKEIVRLEHPDALVSYADPNAGHHGGVYRAASWMYHGQSEESRCYRDAAGTLTSRRAFHSGKRSLSKAEILALGYTEEKLPGKERFVRAVSNKAKKAIKSAPYPEKMVNIYTNETWVLVKRQAAFTVLLCNAITGENKEFHASNLRSCFRPIS